MYNYNKPLVVETSDLSEGVYAASGDSSGDCWTMSYSYNSSNSTTTNPKGRNLQTHGNRSNQLENLVTILYVLYFCCNINEYN